MQGGWLAELQRRNVPRVVLAYAALAWLLAQVSEFLVDAFGWPAWILRALVLVLLLGLPAVAVLAWFFELTPAGLVRESPEPSTTALRLRPYRRFDLVIAGLVLMAVGYFAATHEWRGESRPPRAAGPASLAVLPFKPIVATSRDESLEFGMADTLITRLSGLTDVAVRPLSSVRRYAALEQDPLVAGRELEVRSVLEGSVQKDGERVRVTARLLDVADGRQLWADRFDESYTDIFAVQDSIADQVTAALALRLSTAEQGRVRRRPTNDAVAYDLFLNGRYHWNRRSLPDDLSKAIEFYERAVARDPDFALAYSGLADALALQVVFGARPPHDVYPVALRHAQRALELDPDLAEAHATRGHVRLYYQYDWKGALEDFDEAIRHDPRYAMAYMWRGFWRLRFGQVAEGLADLQTATELEPDSLTLAVNQARGLYWARRYDEAATRLERILELEPANALARAMQARVFTQLGRYEEALELARGKSEQTPGGFALAGIALARAGRPEEARAELRRIDALARERYVPAYDRAAIHAALGDADGAFEWLDHALTERGAHLPLLLMDPVMDALRGDPRYPVIAAKLGYPTG